MAAAGADVLVHTRASEREASEISHQICQLGRVSTVQRCDLSDAAASRAFADSAWDWQGHVDIWVNNAGADVLTGDAAAASFESKLEQLWKVDVLATIRLSRWVGAQMVQRYRETSASGTIINMSWDQAAWGMGGDSGEMFAATKGAIAAFSRSLAKSLAPAVRVNCLAPGWIRTAWGLDASDYWQGRAERESLVGRWGTVEDVANAACFLASPGAAFINGQILAVNGGFRSET